MNSEALNDARVAEVTISLYDAELLVKSLESQLELDKAMSFGYVEHSQNAGTDRDIERVRNAIAAIKRAAKKGEPLCTMPLSGQEVLSLERFTSHQTPRAIETLRNSYLQNPNKTEPVRRFDKVKKLFRKHG
ncbi:MAG: hypothetical protein ACM3IJ_03960 [Candidatus Levyibacteriota bacterium]